MQSSDEESVRQLFARGVRRYDIRAIQGVDCAKLALQQQHRCSFYRTQLAEIILNDEPLPGGRWVAAISGLLEVGLSGLVAALYPAFGLWMGASAAIPLLQQYHTTAQRAVLPDSWRVRSLAQMRLEKVFGELYGKQEERLAGVGSVGPAGTQARDIARMLVHSDAGITGLDMSRIGATFDSSAVDFAREVAKGIAAERAIPENKRGVPDRAAMEALQESVGVYSNFALRAGGGRRGGSSSSSAAAAANGASSASGGGGGGDDEEDDDDNEGRGGGRSAAGRSDSREQATRPAAGQPVADPRFLPGPLSAQGRQRADEERARHAARPAGDGALREPPVQSAGGAAAGSGAAPANAGSGGQSEEAHRLAAEALRADARARELEAAARVAEAAAKARTAEANSASAVARANSRAAVASANALASKASSEAAAAASAAAEASANARRAESELKNVREQARALRAYALLVPPSKGDGGGGGGTVKDEPAWSRAYPTRPQRECTVRRRPRRRRRSRD